MKKTPCLQDTNRVVVALSLARFADALGTSLLFVLLPIYIAASPPPDLPWTETFLIGVVLSLYGLVNAVLQPFVGIFIDRIRSRKPFIISGLLLLSLGTAALIFSRSYTDVVVIHSLQGIGVALTVPASLTLISSSTVRETRGRSMGFYSTLRLMGFAIGPLMGGSLQLRMGFKMASLWEREQFSWQPSWSSSGCRNPLPGRDRSASVQQPFWIQRSGTGA